MTDEVANMVLEQLRHMRSKIDRIADDVVELKQRVTALETAFVRLQHSFDRMAERVTRIEQRLDIVDAG